jgi:hypothetical protein
MLGPFTTFRILPIAEGPEAPREPGEPATPEQIARRELGEALDAFLAAHDDAVIGISRVINPMLGLWEAAHAVSGAAARPIEEKLTVFVKRQCTSRAELARMTNEVKEALRSDMAEPASFGAS